MITLVGGVGGFSVRFDPSSEIDVSGYVIHAVHANDLVNGDFTPTVNNIINRGPETNIYAPVELSGSWYVKVAAYDVFGEDLLNWSDTYEVTVLTPFDELPTDLATMHRVDFFIYDTIFMFDLPGEDNIAPMTMRWTTGEFAQGASTYQIATGSMDNAEGKYIIFDNATDPVTVTATSVYDGVPTLTDTQTIVAITSKSPLSSNVYACYVRQANSVQIEGALIRDATITDAKISGTLSANRITTINGGVVIDGAGITVSSLGETANWGNVSGEGKPEDGATRNSFLGDWTTGVQYSPGDEVSYEGSTWACILASLSSVSNPPPTLPETSNTWWSLRARAGSDGSAADYVLVTGDQVFKYENGSLTPTATNITLTALLAGGLTTYAWEYHSGAMWLPLSGTNNTSTYTLAHNNVAWGVETNTLLRVRCRSTDTKYDEITIIKIKDGINALAGYLTNESHTIPTDDEGNNGDYTDATGRFKVFFGTTDVTSSCTFSKVSQVGCTGTIASDGVYAVSAVTGLTAALTVRSTYQSKTIDKVFSLCKSLAGAAGPVARSFYVSGPTTFKYLSGATAPTDTSNTYTATPSDGWTPAGYLWQYYDTGASGWAALTGTNDTTTYTLAHDSLVWGGKTTLRIRCLSEGIWDEVSIAKLYDATTSLSGYLTNEAHTVLFDPSGTTGDFTGAGGNFKILKGTTDVTAGCTFTKTATGCTGTVSAAGVYAVTAFNTGVTSATLSMVATHTESGATLTKVFSVTKSLSNQKVIISGEQAFKYASGATVPNPSAAIVLSATLTGGLTTYRWQYLSGSSWLDLSGTNNLPAYSLTYYNAAWGTANILHVRCLSGTVSDEMTIAKLYDGDLGPQGAAGLTAILSNETHSVPCNSSGTPTSYSSSGTDIYVYEGVDAFAYVTSLTGPRQFTVSVSASGITCGARSAGTSPNRCIVANHSAMSANPAKITFTIVARKVDGTDITITKDQTLPKAIAGATGGDGADGSDGSITYSSSTAPTVGVKAGDQWYNTGPNSGTYRANTLHHYNGSTWVPKVNYTYISTDDGTIITGAISASVINAINFTTQTAQIAGNAVTVPQTATTGRIDFVSQTSIVRSVFSYVVDSYLAERALVVVGSVDYLFVPGSSAVAYSTVGVTLRKVGGSNYGDQLVHAPAVVTAGGDKSIGTTMVACIPNGVPVGTYDVYIAATLYSATGAFVNASGGCVFSATIFGAKR